MIISVATAKDYMKIDSGETAWDTLITALITESQNEIEAYCGQRFEQSERTYIFDGNGLSEYIFTTLPVASSPVATLHYRDTPFDSWTAIASTEVTILRDKGVYSMLYTGLFIENRLNYKITATVGYASGSIPAILNAVLKEMTYVKFRESAQGAAMLAKTGTSRSIDGFAQNETYEDLRPKWYARLRSFRRIPA